MDEFKLRRRRCFLELTFLSPIGGSKSVVGVSSSGRGVKISGAESSWCCGLCCCC